MAENSPMTPPSTTLSPSNHSQSWGQRHHRGPSGCPGYPTLPPPALLHLHELQPFGLHSPVPQYHRHFPSPLGRHQYPREERQRESLGRVRAEMGLEGGREGHLLRLACQGLGNMGYNGDTLIDTFRARLQGEFILTGTPGSPGGPRSPGSPVGP